jgi:hypothetical protein
MIKKIIIYSLVFAVLFVALTLYSLNRYGTVSAATIIIPTIIFAVLFIRNIILPMYKDFKPNNERLFGYENVQMDLSKLKKISTKSSFLGLEKRLLEDQDYYFDANYFYPVNKSGNTIKIPLTEISEVSKTNIAINRKRVWQVKATHQNQLVVFKFMDNDTLFNSNFKQFLDYVKKINPTVVKTGLLF